VRVGLRERCEQLEEVMPKVSSNNTTNYPAGTLERPDYQPGNYLLPDDLKTGQNYLQQRLRRHNRMLHGEGVICGMKVTPANDPSHPWGVYVCPGYAIGPYGDEIVLVQQELVDISEFLWMDFAATSPQKIAYVGVSYVEELVEPVPAETLVCECDEPTYTPSRIKDSHQLSVLWTNPREKHPLPSICSSEVVPCEKCPKDPYLLLAWISLPASVGDSIVAANIVNM
jgi:hypothetical protein